MVPFRYVHHLLAVPVNVGGVESTFVLDTGIGLTLVAESLAASVGCAPSGETYTGKRMSGQEVHVPLGVVDSLAVGGAERRDLTVGILDLAAFPGLEDVGGFVSLEFFRDRPFTVDYPSGNVVVEDDASLAARAAAGTSVAVRVWSDEQSLEVFLPLDVPGAGSLSVEVDTGSDSLILDERFAEPTGALLTGPDVRVVDGTDETGHAYRRTFTRLGGAIHPTGAPHLAQRDPEVMFQRIIHDGLVGDAFLRDYVVTYDVPGARMIFGN